MTNKNTNGGGFALEFSARKKVAANIILTEVTLVWVSYRSDVHVKIHSKKFPESMDPYEIGRVPYGGKSFFFYGRIGFSLKKLE